MRGISGLVRFDSAPVNPAQIGAMIGAMAICPTDRIQTWCEGSAGLAHLVQNILPEDRFEAQPLVNPERGFALVTDALLDNRDELAADFGWTAHEAATKADSAFVLAAYERWGEECPARLEGGFTLAVWHPRKRRLFAAVDPLGFRPFYYSQRAGRFGFASTLKGLFALTDVSRELNEAVFAAHVAGVQSVDPETLYRDVQRINGGHRLTIDPMGCRIARYWNPDPHRILRLRSDAEYLEAYRAEFERAVKTAMRRRRGEVGIMLSGGLDSSAVAAVAGRMLARDGRRLQAIHQFRPGVSRYRAPLRELDESPYVEAFRTEAPHIDFHHVASESEAAPFSDWDAFFDDHLVPFRGLPLQTDPQLANLLDRLEIGMLLNGLGGNYLASLECHPTGYLTHLAITGRCSTWLREIRGHHRIYGPSLRHLVRRTAIGPALRWRRRWQSPPVREFDGVRLLHPELRARTGIEGRLREHEQSWHALPWNFRARLHRILTEVTVQQTGTAPSVIGRHRATRRSGAPMFDRRFNEFCLALPFDQQIRDGRDRRLIRESMRGLLPDAVRLRVSRGFPQPDFARQFSRFQNELRSEFERLGSSSIARAYLDYEWLATLWNSTERNKNSWSIELLQVHSIALARFLAWHERWSAKRR